uniref:(northern house mosquito) hypothetical protein n=1 Tax=Culex pipiens TaxID=7175 RepID=A0A8D8CZ43_CULPI
MRLIHPGKFKIVSGPKAQKISHSASIPQPFSVPAVVTQKGHTTEGGHLKTRLHRVRMVSSSTDFFTCSSNQLCNTVATKPPSAVTEGRKKILFQFTTIAGRGHFTTTDSRGSTRRRTNTLCCCCCRCTCVGTQSRVRPTDVACVYWWPLYTTTPRSEIGPPPVSRAREKRGIRKKSRRL